MIGWEGPKSLPPCAHLLVVIDPEAEHLAVGPSDLPSFDGDPGAANEALSGAFGWVRRRSHDGPPLLVGRAVSLAFDPNWRHLSSARSECWD